MLKVNDCNNQADQTDGSGELTVQIIKFKVWVLLLVHVL